MVADAGLPVNIDISPKQSLFVKDIVLDPEIDIHDDPEQLVVKVSEVIVKIEEEKPVVEEEEEEGEGEAVAEGEEKPEGVAEKPEGEAETEKKAPEQKE